MVEFTVTYSLKESTDIYAALRQGLWLANWAKQNNMIGADEYIDRIKRSVDLVGKKRANDPRTPSEIHASSESSLLAEMKQWGCD